MPATVNKYLNLIDLSQLDNWSVQTLLDSTVNYSNIFELARIGEFLIKNRTTIDVEDDKEYRRVTVKINNNGVLLRDIEKGINIGTKKQYLAKAGQFIVSRIDARNGAFGIIPEDLDGAIVTNDFPLFDVNHEKINPQFLLLITSTKEFIKFAQSCSSGTTNRQRMDIDMFLNQKVPLPSLIEQISIIKSHYDQIKESEKLYLESKNLRNKIDSYLLDQLGIKAKEAKIFKNGIQFIESRYLDKWGLDFIKNDLVSAETKFEKYSIKQLCKISSGGTPSRSRKEYFENGVFPWIKTGELDNKVIYETEEYITSDALRFSSAKLYEPGCIVIAMYGATIGKTAKLGVPASTNQACAVLFDINNKIINTDFLWEFLQTQTSSLKELAYGSAQPNLNAGIISNYEIVVPTLSLQSQIVKQISFYKKQIDKLVSDSIRISLQAKIDFEKNIFN